MDPTSFAIVRGEVQRLPLKDDKVKAIAYAQGNLYAEQVAELMRAFSFDDGRLKGIQACVGKDAPSDLCRINSHSEDFLFRHKQGFGARAALRSGDRSIELCCVQ